MSEAKVGDEADKRETHRRVWVIVETEGDDSWPIEVWFDEEIANQRRDRLDQSGCPNHSFAASYKVWELIEGFYHDTRSKERAVYQGQQREPVE